MADLIATVATVVVFSVLLVYGRLWFTRRVLGYDKHSFDGATLLREAQTAYPRVPPTAPPGGCYLVRVGPSGEVRSDGTFIEEGLPLVDPNGDSEHPGREHAGDVSQGNGDTPPEPRRPLRPHEASRRRRHGGPARDPWGDHRG